MATAVRTVRVELPDPGPNEPHRHRARGAGAARSGATVAALGLTALLAASMIRPAAAVESVGAAGGAAVGARLVRPAAYVALAPLCDAYDALSLLTIRQHLAMLAWLALAYVVARVLRARRRPPRARAFAREAGAGLLALLGVVACYAAGALVARPMAALVLADADELAVDVHSHTSASHDGRWHFDAARNRAWHRAAGFDVAYVTDHRAYDGAAAGTRENPARAGQGTVLLPGIETRVGGVHVNVLGVSAVDSVDRGGWLDVARLAQAGRGGAGAPVVVLDEPAPDDERLPPGFRVDAVEVVDGAPRGLAFARVHRATLIESARARDARLVAGSDIHGWGRTAAGWTVLRVPGWRAMAPARLDSALRVALRDPRMVRVIARTTPWPPVGALQVAIAPPAVAWHMLAAGDGAEHASWLIWTWGLWSLGALLRRRAVPA